MADSMSTTQRRNLMSRIRSKDTTPELIVRRLAFRAGYRFRLHSHHLPGRPDIVFPSRCKVILVHVCSWHRHNCANGRVEPKTRTAFWNNKFESNIARDIAVKGQLRRDGWKVLVVWECETRARSHDRLLSRLKTFLGES